MMEQIYRRMMSKYSGNMHIEECCEIFPQMFIMVLFQLKQILNLMLYETLQGHSHLWWHCTQAHTHTDWYIFTTKAAVDPDKSMWTLDERATWYHRHFLIDLLYRHCQPALLSDFDLKPITVHHWARISCLALVSAKKNTSVFGFFCTKSSWIKTLACCRKCWPQTVSLTISVGTRRTLSTVLFSFSLLILVPHPSLFWL